MVGFLEWENRVVLNVGGIRHETYRHVLRKVQATRLSRLTEKQPNYDRVKNEYFFDRHPGVFSHILNYYRTGKLHYPTNVCGVTFEEELAFWGIDSNEVEPCCWMTYTRHRDTETAINVIESLDRDTKPKPPEEIARTFGFLTQFQTGNTSLWQKQKPKIWSLLHEPWTSASARAIQVLSILIGSISIVAAMVSTYSFSSQDCSDDYKPTSTMFIVVAAASNFQNQNRTLLAKSVSTVGDEVDTCTAINKSSNEAVQSAITWIQLVCQVYLLLELVLRFAIWPNKFRFFKTFINVFDFLATLAFFTYGFVALFFADNDDNYKSAFYGIFNVVNTFRLYRVSQYSTDFRILMHTFMASAQELLLMVFFIVICMVMFSALAYYAERTGTNPHNNFYSISKGLWWVIITFSIGYGDMIPATSAGKAVGALLVFTGTFIMALPVPIFLHHFQLIYEHHLVRNKLPSERRFISSRDGEQEANMFHSPEINNQKPAKSDLVSQGPRNHM